MKFPALLALALLPACKPAASTNDSSVGPTLPLAADSPWPKFRADAAQDGRGAALASDGSGQPWSYTTGAGVFSSPVIAGDGTIYIGSADHTFYALTADGSLRWSLPVGEIIDSSAILDADGRVIFPCGDGHVYAVDAATGATDWTFAADDPSTTGAFINWFEGNIAMLPDGTLVAGNDNFRVYAIDGQSGAGLWSFTMPDQTWSSAAVDIGANDGAGTMYIGNNDLLGRGNTYAIGGSAGTKVWSNADSLGTVAASPVLYGPTRTESLMVGGFDGYARAYDATNGQAQWTFGALDHLYSSPALLSDGTIIQAGADGTIYALNPADGSVVWAYDTLAPLRSSPAVGADDVVYVGGGDGRLYAVNADGSLRWSMLLAAGDRNDLNSSPALGAHAIVIGSESGEVWSVPYDWCLQNADDTRCSTASEPFPTDGGYLWVTSRFGNVSPTTPTSLAPTEPFALSLVDRVSGDNVLALIDTSTVTVTVDPPVAVDVVVSADRRFLTVSPPASGWSGDSVHITVNATTLTNPDRTGLRFVGGTPAGAVAADLTFAVERSSTAAAPAPNALWLLSRLAAPLPTILPSYNQIGFDNLAYVLSVVTVDASADGHSGVGFVTGAGTDGTPDPASQAMFPVTWTFADGALDVQAAGGMSLNVMNVDLSFDAFRVDAALDGSGDGVGGAVMEVRAICADIPLYGPYLRTLGLCNPDTDALEVYGGADLHTRGTAPSLDVGPVTFARTDTGVTATFAPGFGTTDHRVAVVIVDTATGLPVSADYGTGTTVTGDGSAMEVDLAAAIPDSAHAYLLVDGFVAGDAGI